LKKRYLDQGEVKNIDDVDLSDPLHLRRIIEEWYTVENLSEHHLKVRDLFMDLEDRWIHSSLNDQQRNAIRLYLIEGYTQREAGDLLEVGTRAIASAVNDGLKIMASYGDTHDG